jgi:hypothetical protein
MPINWKNPDYLKTGSVSQQMYFELIQKSRVLSNLDKFSPVLVGSIPLDIDIPGSDIDIICYIRNFEEFTNELKKDYSLFEQFTINQKKLHDIPSVICRFIFSGKMIEIVGQDVLVEEQIAFRHMVNEHQILECFGEEFKKKIIELKLYGMKTEPAFAFLLGIEGDPYQAILNYPH